MRISKKRFIKDLNGARVFFYDRYLRAKIERAAIVLYNGGGVGMWVHTLSNYPKQQYKQKYYKIDNAYIIKCFYKKKLTQIIALNVTE